MCECKCSCNCNDDLGEPQSISFMIVLLATLGIGYNLSSNGYELSEIRNILFFSWVTFVALIALIIIKPEIFKPFAILLGLFGCLAVIHFIFWIGLLIAL
jgi:hypothetical protein